MHSGLCYLGVICFTTFISSGLATTTCDVDATTNCNYVVTCSYHAGSAANPNCEREPNVTFIITNSNASPLTTNFFGATNFDSRVRTLIAANNSWSSIATSAFRYYSKARRFDLSENSINEIQEDAFKYLSLLTYLNISHNSINRIGSRAFVLSELMILDLSYNRITILSYNVFDLPNLTDLYLQENQINTISDDCFRTLNNLNNLQLHHNSLERLNLSFIYLRTVMSIDLSCNRLKTMSAYETNKLAAIETLNVSYNALQSIDTNCFVQSPELQVVDFSYNQLSMPIENVMFASNSKLKVLYLNDNNITNIDGNSFKHNQLKDLRLQNNKISNDISDKTFVGLQNITNLNLSKQNLSRILDYAFLDMKHLATLNLSWNSINYIENMSFWDVTLTILDLSYNNITDINFLKNCLVNVTELYINNNNISILFENAFQNQTMLKKLELSGNKIYRIEKNSLPLQNLQYLNLFGNNITGTLEENMFSPAKFLRFLDLSNFNLTKINNSTFVDMPVLVRLNMSHNGIEYIAENNFKGMANLYSLDISHNNLVDLQFNNNIMTNLKAAYLNNNKLSNVSRIFSNTSHLLYLDVSHNNFSDLSNLDDYFFPELQVLHFSHNKIKDFNNPHTNTLSQLVDLGLSSNNINFINLSYFKELQIVDLSHNNLQVINITFFNNIEIIQSIDLSHNNISDIPPGTFQNMKNMKFLNLSSNYITRLRYGSLKGLHRTELLDLSNNMIDSLDVYVFHECTELKTLIIDYNRIKTLDIERLVLVTQRKLKTLSLGGNPISCQEIIRNATLKDLSSYGVTQIVVTSIHQIYNEDNVHGIKCGEDISTTTENIDVPVEDNGDSSSSLILVWCSLLTLLVLLAGVAVLYKLLRKRKNFTLNYRESRMQLRNSLELDGPEYNVIN